MTDTTNRRLRACIAACEGIDTESLETLGRGGIKSERDECDQLRATMADLLTRTANAIRGEPEPLHRHGWHDLPERAQAVMAALGMAMEVAAEAAKGRRSSDAQATPDGRVGEIIEQLRAVCEDGCPPGLPLEAADAMEILVEQRDAARKRTAALLVERDALSVEFDALRNQQPVAWATRLGVPLYAHPVPAQSAPDVDFIVEQLSGFADHNIEQGRMSFDRFSLREAIESALAAAPKPEVK